MPPIALNQADLNTWIGGNVTAISAYLTYARGESAATVVHGQVALQHLPVASTVIRTATHLMVGVGALDSDQGALAETHLRQAIVCGQTGGNPYAALTAQGVLGTLLLRQGRLATAEHLLRIALDTQRDSNDTPLPIAGDLCVRLGQVRHERNDLAGAVTLLAQGRRCGELVANGWTVQSASLALAWTRFVQGEAAAAHAQLDTLEALAPRLEPIVDRSLIRALRARMQHAAGERSAVQAWLEYETAHPSAGAVLRARALRTLGHSEEIDAGLTNQALAEQLVITVGTVKW